VPRAIHVPCTHPHQNEVFGIRMFMLFLKNSFIIYQFFWHGYIGSEVGGSILLQKDSNHLPAVTTQISEDLGFHKHLSQPQISQVSFTFNIQPEICM
jgi:hypothetical protein